MFGFFRKKTSDAPSSSTSNAVEEKAPGAELTVEQKRMVTEELERQGRGDGNRIDAAIGLLHMTGDKFYLKGILQFLENAEIGLLLKEPAAGTDYLILTHENLRYLPIFTRPEHARAIAGRFPAYRHIGIVNSRGLFSRITPGMGLWINPGHSIFTYMMPAAMFTSYVAMLTKKR